MGAYEATSWRQTDEDNTPPLDQDSPTDEVEIPELKEEKIEALDPEQIFADIPEPDSTNREKTLKEVAEDIKTDLLEFNEHLNKAESHIPGYLKRKNPPSKNTELVLDRINKFRNKTIEISDQIEQILQGDEAFKDVNWLTNKLLKLNTEIFNELKYFFKNPKGKPCFTPYEVATSEGRKPVKWPLYADLAYEDLYKGFTGSIQRSIAALKHQNLYKSEFKVDEIGNLKQQYAEAGLSIYVHPNARTVGSKKDGIKKQIRSKPFFGFNLVDSSKLEVVGCEKGTAEEGEANGKLGDEYFEPAEKTTVFLAEEVEENAMMTETDEESFDAEEARKADALYKEAHSAVSGVIVYLIEQIFTEGSSVFHDLEFLRQIFNKVRAPINAYETTDITFDTSFPAFDFNQARIQTNILKILFPGLSITPVNANSYNEQRVAECFAESAIINERQRVLRCQLGESLNNKLAGGYEATIFPTIAEHQLPNLLKYFEERNSSRPLDESDPSPLPVEGETLPTPAETQDPPAVEEAPSQEYQQAYDTLNGVVISLINSIFDKGSPVYGDAELLKQIFNTVAAFRLRASYNVNQESFATAFPNLKFDVETNIAVIETLFPNEIIKLVDANTYNQEAISGLLGMAPNEEATSALRDLNDSIPTFIANYNERKDQRLTAVTRQKQRTRRFLERSGAVTIGVIAAATVLSFCNPNGKDKLETGTIVTDSSSSITDIRSIITDKIEQAALPADLTSFSNPTMVSGITSTPTPAPQPTFSDHQHSTVWDAALEIARGDQRLANGISTTMLGCDPAMTNSIADGINGRQFEQLADMVQSYGFEVPDGAKSYADLQNAVASGQIRQDQADTSMTQIAAGAMTSTQIAQAEGCYTKTQSIQIHDAIFSPRIASKTAQVDQATIATPTPAPKPGLWGRITNFFK